MPQATASEHYRKLPIPSRQLSEALFTNTEFRARESEGSLADSLAIYTKAIDSEFKKFGVLPRALSPAKYVLPKVDEVQRNQLNYSLTMLMRIDLSGLPPSSAFVGLRDELDKNWPHLKRPSDWTFETNSAKDKCQPAEKEKILKALASIAIMRLIETGDQNTTLAYLANALALKKEPGNNTKAESINFDGFRVSLIQALASAQFTIKHMPNFAFDKILKPLNQAAAPEGKLASAYDALAQEFGILKKQPDLTSATI